MHSLSLVGFALISCATAFGSNAALHTQEDQFLLAQCYPDTNGTESSPCAQFSSITIECSEVNPADAQTCACRDNYFFFYAAGCMECLRLHGAPEESFNTATEKVGFVPVPYVSAASRSYCHMASTQELVDFLTSFTATATVNKGKYTSVSDLLGTNTAVSNYIIATSKEYSSKTASLQSANATRSFGSPNPSVTGYNSTAPSSNSTGHAKTTQKPTPKPPQTTSPSTTQLPSTASKTTSGGSSTPSAGENASKDTGSGRQHVSAILVLVFAMCYLI
ncbi:MAG: hypothetical protein M4579_000032 [Chaenotheca gracillima]|nr:MAG: hypothetical protein M4579_000032 [Chaenotheca gracillima]